ncbi:hypothetical protein ABW19_dt0205760 [Dactylella cylindrospora]|nr:hypothetical protein ABW19_dt0205760 [Dactylella cylindrospora]
MPDRTSNAPLPSSEVLPEAAFKLSATASISPSLLPSFSNRQPSVDQPTPPISSLPPNVTLRPPTKANIALLKRINSLLLPVSYPENFYRDILQRPESEILTRLAFYDDECVGGIRCRVETPAEYKEGLEKLGLGDGRDSKIIRAAMGDGSFPSGSQPDDGSPKGKIYIMTLAVLSPYRSLSIGTHLLDYIMSTAAKNPLINADEAYAHVWVANDGALEFYRKQGFDVTSGAVVHNYYRRLEPHDAKIVFRKVTS